MPNISVCKKKSVSLGIDQFFYLYLLFLCFLLFVRDILSFSVPLIVFVGYFAFGFLIFDFDCSFALSTTLPILSHGVQTNYIVFVAVLFYLFKYGKNLKITLPHFVFLFLMILEAFNMLEGYFSYSDYLRYFVNYAYIALILGESRINRLLKKPIIAIKSFLLMSTYFMFEVSLLTLKYYSISEILSPNFRFGTLSDVLGDAPALFDNQNMVAMFAIVSISLIVVCAFKNRKWKALDVCLIFYFMFFGILTVSRTFVICSLIFSLMCAWFYMRKSFLKAIPIIVILFLVIILLANTIFSGFVEKVLIRFSADDVSGGRIGLFKLYNAFIFSDLKHLFFGIGLQNVDLKAGINNTPHNAIQETVLCWGIIGLILVSCLFYVLIKKYNSYKAKNEKEVYMFPLIVYFIFIQTIQLVRLTSIIGLIILFYAVILLGSYDDKKEVNNYN